MPHRCSQTGVSKVVLDPAKLTINYKPPKTEQIKATTILCHGFYWLRLGTTLG